MQMLNAMSGDSTESPQKSMDLQEIAHPPYTKDSEKLLKQIEPSTTDSNIDTAKGPEYNGIISTEYTTKSHLQDASRIECLVKKEVLQKDIVGDCLKESTTLQPESLGQHEYIANTVQKNTLQTVPHDSGASLDKSAEFENNSLNPSNDVLVDSDLQMKIQESDVSLYKTDSSTDPKADTENRVPSSRKEYYGRSVSVQLCSGLASQSSLRGSTNHSSSTGHSPTSDYIIREQLDSDVANISDNAQSANTCTTMEHTLSNPWCFHESSKRPYLLDKGRSYEDDTRWEAALWSGVQSCGSCGHKGRCCCQNKNSKKTNSSSTEELNQTSSLPVSHPELNDRSLVQEPK